MNKITEEQAKIIKSFEFLEKELNELKKAHPEEYKIYQGYRVWKAIRN